jgi:quinol-cytochrome oxidoreductase complex cytochrome b subunit
MYVFGILALICLLIQIISGIFISMHYYSDVNLAFISIENFVRNVKEGYLTRYIHANGASMFFIVIFLHMGRGLFFGSYKNPREALWYTGTIIYILLIITAFLGYVLPWGQMSYWAATVITNLVTTIPIIGTQIVTWIWGAYAVEGPTLSRFFILHFLLPFILLLIVVSHLIFLHQVGSSNPLGFTWLADKVYFFPHYVAKDGLIAVVSLFIFTFLVSQKPDMLGHPDNYIPANPEATPAHIVPEWYFLNFYAVLRSIPSKDYGVIALAMTIICLLILPILDQGKKNSTIFGNKIPLKMFFITFICLTYIGKASLKEPALILGLTMSLSYFIFYLIKMLNPNTSGKKRYSVNEKTIILFGVKPILAVLALIGFFIKRIYERMEKLGLSIDEGILRLTIRIDEGILRLYIRIDESVERFGDILMEKYDRIIRRIKNWLSFYKKWWKRWRNMKL